MRGQRLNERILPDFQGEMHSRAIFSVCSSGQLQSLGQVGVQESLIALLYRAEGPSTSLFHTIRLDSWLK
jgi:hypothetical protein